LGTEDVVEEICTFVKCEKEVNSSEANSREANTTEVDWSSKAFNDRVGQLPFTVDNLGPDAATNVAVEDLVPNGYSAISNIRNGERSATGAWRWRLQGVRPASLAPTAPLSAGFSSRLERWWCIPGTRPMRRVPSIWPRCGSRGQRRAPVSDRVVGPGATRAGCREHADGLGIDPFLDLAAHLGLHGRTEQALVAIIQGQPHLAGIRTITTQHRTAHEADGFLLGRPEGELEHLLVLATEHGEYPVTGCGPGVRHNQTSRGRWLRPLPFP